MISSRTNFYRFKVALVLLMISLTYGGCVRSKGVLRGSFFETRDTRYRLGETPAAWKRMSLRGADLAYLNEANGSTLLVNSMCGDKSDAPLIALTYHLLIGMTEQNVIEQKSIPLSDREGLETTATAKLDGVTRQFQIMVLKKNYCIYDIVLTTSPENFKGDLKVYENVLRGFEVPGASV